MTDDEEAISKFVNGNDDMSIFDFKQRFGMLDDECNNGEAAATTTKTRH